MFSLSPSTSRPFSFSSSSANAKADPEVASLETTLTRRPLYRLSRTLSRNLGKCPRFSRHYSSSPSSRSSSSSSSSSSASYSAPVTPVSPAADLPAQASVAASLPLTPPSTPTSFYETSEAESLFLVPIELVPKGSLNPRRPAPLERRNTPLPVDPRAAGVKRVELKRGGWVGVLHESSS